MDNQVKCLRNVISGRTVIAMLPGASLSQMENRITDFADRDVCYASINHPWVIEKRILSKIGRTIDIVVRSAKECGVPSAYDDEFLTRAKSNLLITEESSFYHSLLEYKAKYADRLFFFTADRTPQALTYPDKEHPFHFLAQASFSILFTVLAIGEPERIVIFGADGWTQDDCLPEYADWVQGPARGRIYDTALFNQTFPAILTNTCLTHNIPWPEIINCTDKSYYTCLPAKTYDETLCTIKYRQPR